MAASSQLHPQQQSMRAGGDERHWSPTRGLPVLREPVLTPSLGAPVTVPSPLRWAPTDKHRGHAAAGLEERATLQLKIPCRQRCDAAVRERAELPGPCCALEPREQLFPSKPPQVRASNPPTAGNSYQYTALYPPPSPPLHPGTPAFAYRGEQTELRTPSCRRLGMGMKKILKIASSKKREKCS